jgi:D-alanyl-D-alanine carboxypeptidase (penicillin-binding protein 5/6)
MGRYNIFCCKQDSKRRLILPLLLSVIVLFIGLIMKKPLIYNTYAEDFRNQGSSAIVIEAKTKKVMYEDNINTRLPMASTTKVMTALIVLENTDIEKKIKIPKEAVGIEGSSIYLKENDEWLIKDLLYGLMLRSGNDSAIALSIATAGSVEKFVNLMNDKVKQLNLINTNFTNPHGLHNDNHYTSAYDLSVITAEAFKYDQFKEIVSTKKYYNKDTNIMFFSKNKFLNMCEGANGVKTGFTKVSGRCLVSAALRDNMQLIAVVLNKGDMYNESASIINRSFNKYCDVKLYKKGDIVGNINVSKGLKISTSLYLNEDIEVILNKDYNKEKITTDLILNNDLIEAPIKANTAVGDFEVYYDNHLIFKTKVYTIEDIKEKGALDRLREKFDKWFRKK